MRIFREQAYLRVALNLEFVGGGGGGGPALVSTGIFSGGQLSYVALSDFYNVHRNISRMKIVVYTV